MNDVKIILTGASGRMGRAIRELAASNENVSITAAVDITPGVYEMPFYNGIDELPDTKIADVIIDFSHHTAIEGILNYAKKTGCAAIICTTGHTEAELDMIEKASKEIALFRSGNMSLGINMLMALVEKAASVLNGFDIEIIEKHHNQKLDAPSGTAIMLEKAAENGLKYTPTTVYDRHSVRQKRSSSEIGIHSVRGGTIVGEHEVIFAGTNETVTLSHSAQSREVFASGAISAAIYMKDKAPGLYSMKDVIEASL